MPHFDWTINVPTLIAWAVAGGTVVWKASALVTELRNLIADFVEHKSDDNKHWDEVKGVFRDQETRLRSLEIAQAGHRN